MTQIFPTDIPSHEPKTSRRGVFSWMLFDWAAQPYHTLLVTFIFAPYFVAFVAPSGVEGQALWGYATSAAGLIIALSAPLLGVFSDRLGPKKPWIAVFSLMAVIGATSLYLAEPGGSAPILLILTAYALALVGIELAAVFINAMMPNLVPRAQIGKLSGSGWALGYIGGLVALILCLGFMSANPQTGKTLLGFAPVLGLDPLSHEGDRAAGPFSALWYFIFVIPFFLFTPDMGKRQNSGMSVGDGLKKLVATFRSLPQRRSYFSFLISSMLYRDGLNALYAFGGIYAAGVLRLPILSIGVFGIIAAASGALGAFIGGRLDTRFGPRPVVFVSCWLLVLACVIVVSTTPDTFLFFLPVASQSLPLLVFYFAGALIGAAGGALQAASRTLLIDQVSPKEATEAFGIYALAGRATAFVGPLAVAIFTTLTQSQRFGITPVIVLIGAGAIGLFWVKTSHSDEHVLAAKS